jgi:histone-lysine N-methyltransferase EZH2
MEIVREKGECGKETTADVAAEGVAVAVGEEIDEVTSHAKLLSNDGGGKQHDDLPLPALDTVLAGIITGAKKVEKQTGTKAQIAARAAATQAAPPSRRMSPSMSPPRSNKKEAAANAHAINPAVPTTRPTTPTDQQREQQQQQQQQQQEEGEEGSPLWKLWEDAALEKGMQVWGRQPCKIAVLVGSRTCAQVRQRMMILLNSPVPTKLNRRNSSYGAAAGVIDGTGNGTATNFEGAGYGDGLHQNRRKRKGGKNTNRQPIVVNQRLKRSTDEAWPQFHPCGCDGPCREGCPCVDDANFCEKFCGCDPAWCGNRFQGCQCRCGVYFNKRCTTRQCPCLAAGRECDPDLCKLCIPTLYNANEPGYQCNNFRIRLRQKRRVLMGLSDVQGWGAFLAGPAVKKDGFIGEYCGELIDQLEADRRGKVYDRDDNSYLFDLNQQWVIDARQKGNKLRFANHSTTANCRAEILLVDGHHRVAILANKDLLPGDELFYDYKYATNVAPDWAQQYRGSGGGRGAGRGGRGSRSRREDSAGAVGRG